MWLFVLDIYTDPPSDEDIHIMDRPIYPKVEFGNSYPTLTKLDSDYFFFLHYIYATLVAHPSRDLPLLPFIL